ncbi:hypothetical protein SLE2022_285690 [Rubroshorea leprosula]
MPVRCRLRCVAVWLSIESFPKHHHWRIVDEDDALPAGKRPSKDQHTKHNGLAYRVRLSPTYLTIKAPPPFFLSTYASAPTKSSASASREESCATTCNASLTAAPIAPVD